VAAIELRDVHKRYRVYRERYRSLKEIAIHRRLGEWEDRWALQGVTLDVEPGTTLGLIGNNGAGKSTALKLMARILSPDRGSVNVRGRLSGLIELGSGFQLEYTGRENVFLNASLLGMSRGEAERRFDDIVAFAELEDHIGAPLRTYSSGMYMRLGFSVAIHVDPEILLVDEILAVGDEAFQRKCIDWLEAFQRRGGTVVMVSHNLGAIRHLCDQAAWIGEGRLLAMGKPDAVLTAYGDSVREQRMAAAEAGHMGGAGAEPPAVQLGEVRLLDEEGRPVQELESGAGLSLEIDYRCNRRLEAPVFGVALYRNDGAYVYGTNTSVDGVHMPAIEADGRITLRYRSLPLLPGTYVVTVAIFQGVHPDVVAVDYRERYYRFSVAGQTEEQGLVRLDHEWNLAAEATGSRRRG
jgi:ABC-type polysaccharide/polyol phosphate transport system ATPase subunit